MLIDSSNRPPFQISEFRLWAMDYVGMLVRALGEEDDELVKAHHLVMAID